MLSSRVLTSKRAYDRGLVGQPLPEYWAPTPRQLFAIGGACGLIELPIYAPPFCTHLVTPMSFASVRRGLSFLSRPHCHPKLSIDRSFSTHACQSHSIRRRLAPGATYTTQLTTATRSHRSFSHSPPRQRPDDNMADGEPTGLIAKSGIELLTFGKALLSSQVTLFSNHLISYHLMSPSHPISFRTA